MCVEHGFFTIASTTLVVICSFTHVSEASYISGSRGKLHLHRVSNDTYTEHTQEGKQIMIEYGDLTCMGWSGGTCRLSACKSERGPTTCMDGKCFCNSGYCATSAGICTMSKPGQWIGSYSVRFVNAYDSNQPFLGIEPDVSSWGKRYYSMASVANSQPQWKLAHTSNGFVRFESILRPRHVLTIYNNRRRRTADTYLQKSPSLLSHTENVLSKNLRSGTRMRNSSHLHNFTNDRQSSEAKISDDHDLWPRLQRLEDTEPIDASFQVRDMPGKGLEIWDPHWEVSVASADRNWWFNDDSANHGVGECHPESWLLSGCKGRELVVFEPKLPPGVATFGDRIKIEVISTWKWWHWVLMIIGFCGLYAFCTMLPSMVRGTVG